MRGNSHASTEIGVGYFVAAHRIQIGNAPAVSLATLDDSMIFVESEPIIEIGRRFDAYADRGIEEFLKMLHAGV